MALAHTLAQRGVPFALATVVRCERPTSAKPGAKALIRGDGTVCGWIGGSCAEPVVVREALQALRDGRPRLVALVGEGGAGPGRRDGVREYPMTCHSGGTVEVFVEPFLPKRALIVIGGGPVAECLAALGKIAGYAVTTEPGIPPDDRAPRLSIPPGAFVVVSTHGAFDEEAVALALEGGAAYVSLVASRRRAGAVLEALRARGIAVDLQRRLRAPAGLDIGAVTPEEIAVSVLAEVVEASRRGTAETGRPEAPAEAAGAPARDPVCGMPVSASATKYRSEVSGRTFFFCSAGCKRTFDQDPTRYIDPARG